MRQGTQPVVQKLIAPADPSQMMRREKLGGRPRGATVQRVEHITQAWATEGKDAAVRRRCSVY